jgi:hypothetical protein
MLNKLLPRTPLGIALTAASVILAVSPEARKMTRRAAVKGISALLSAVDQIKAVASSAQNQFSGILEEGKGTDGAAFSFDKRLETKSLAFETDDTDSERASSDVHEESPPFQPAYNVISDDYIKRRLRETQPEVH